jgi:hypothetical protein
VASRPTRKRRLGGRDHYRKCETFKVGYANKSEALDAAERQMERGYVRPGCHITPYECPLCGEWHVANKQIVPILGDGHERTGD